MPESMRDKGKRIKKVNKYVTKKQDIMYEIARRLDNVDFETAGKVLTEYYKIIENELLLEHDVNIGSIGRLSLTQRKWHWTRSNNTMMWWSLARPGYAIKFVPSSRIKEEIRQRSYFKNEWRSEVTEEDIEAHRNMPENGLIPEYYDPKMSMRYFGKMPGERAEMPSHWPWPSDWFAEHFDPNIPTQDSVSSRNKE